MVISYSAQVIGYKCRDQVRNWYSQKVVARPPAVVCTAVQTKDSCMVEPPLVLHHSLPVGVVHPSLCHVLVSYSVKGITYKYLLYNYL